MGFASPDLSGYASARGLAQRGHDVPTGYAAAFPMTAELQSNVLEGKLPGGEEGVLYHEVKLIEAEVRSSSADVPTH